MISVRVSARKRYNDTGIVVVPEQPVSFAVPDGSRWWDAWLPATANGHLVTPQYLDRLRHHLLAPDLPWFSLIGRTGFDGEPFLIGGGKHVRMRSGGRLLLSANDIPGFFWNNFGAIAVGVSTG